MKVVRLLIQLYNTCVAQGVAFSNTLFYFVFNYFNKNRSQI